MRDTFKKNYTPVTDEQKALVLEIKTKADELESLMLKGVQSREMSIALTNLEQTIMWASKAVFNTPAEKSKT